MPNYREGGEEWYCAERLLFQCREQKGAMCVCERMGEVSSKLSDILLLPK